mmetsp:Transcript_24405/g.40639  ORF Transcript_24405/g.40639 Transcript_24405/m.40639 type:complete len:805 (-) Transcript_24405:313-2727(-)
MTAVAAHREESAQQLVQDVAIAAQQAQVEQLRQRQLQEHARLLAVEKREKQENMEVDESAYQEPPLAAAVYMDRVGGQYNTETTTATGSSTNGPRVGEAVFEAADIEKERKEYSTVTSAQIENRSSGNSTSDSSKKESKKKKEGLRVGCYECINLCFAATQEMHKNLMHISMQLYRYMTSLCITKGVASRTFHLLLAHYLQQQHPAVKENSLHCSLATTASAAGRKGEALSVTPTTAVVVNLQLMQELQRLHGRGELNGTTFADAVLRSQPAYLVHSLLPLLEPASEESAAMRAQLTAQGSSHLETLKAMVERAVRQQRQLDQYEAQERLEQQQQQQQAYNPARGKLNNNLSIRIQTTAGDGDDDEDVEQRSNASSTFTSPRTSPRSSPRSSPRHSPRHSPRNSRPSSPRLTSSQKLTTSTTHSTSMSSTSPTTTAGTGSSHHHHGHGSKKHQFTYGSNVRVAPAGTAGIKSVSMKQTASTSFPHGQSATVSDTALPEPSHFKQSLLLHQLLYPEETVVSHTTSQTEQGKNPVSSNFERDIKSVEKGTQERVDIESEGDGVRDEEEFLLLESVGLYNDFVFSDDDYDVEDGEYDGGDGGDRDGAADSFPMMLAKVFRSNKCLEKLFLHGKLSYDKHITDMVAPSMTELALTTWTLQYVVETLQRMRGSSMRLKQVLNRHPPLEQQQQQPKQIATKNSSNYNSSSPTLQTQMQAPSTSSTTALSAALPSALRRRLSTHMGGYHASIGDHMLLDLLLVDLDFDLFVRTEAHYVRALQSRVFRRWSGVVMMSPSDKMAFRQQLEQEK